MASGQLTALQVTIEPARNSQHPVTLLVYNTNTVNEKVTVQQVVPGGSALTIAAPTLGPGESAILGGIQLGPNDTLQAASTDSGVVNYFCTGLPTNWMGPQTLAIYDTNGAQKNQPANTLSVVNPAVNFKNMIDGGDFTTNPAQRGTSQAADITNSVTYGPDRFAFIGGASSALDWSINADTGVATFSKSLKMQRKSGNSDTAALKIGQVLETSDSIRVQGQQVTFSFWAKSGANFSAAGGNITVKVNSGTGTDDTAANMFSGSWAGQTAPISTTQAITSSYVRYSFTGTVPTTCTQLGVEIDWTGVGTAGADDSVSFIGFQLEVGGAVTPFEHRDVEVELALCQRYYVQINEINGPTFAIGYPSGTNTQSYSIWLPTTMRVAPTVAVTVGGFKVIVDGGAAAAATGLTNAAAHSPTIITLNSTVTLSAAAHSIGLVGSGTTGKITATADY